MTALRQSQLNLASTAVGFFIQLMTPWFKNTMLPSLLNYDGKRQTVQESNKSRTFLNYVLIMLISSNMGETRSGEPIEDSLIESKRSWPDGIKPPCMLNLL